MPSGIFTISSVDKSSYPVVVSNVELVVPSEISQRSCLGPDGIEHEKMKSGAHSAGSTTMVGVKVRDSSPVV